MLLVFFFFFKQKTAYEMRISDWSSDVCSSDLRPSGDLRGKREGPRHSAPPAHRGSQPRPDAPEGKRPAAPPWPYKRARYAMTCGGPGPDAAAIPQSMHVLRSWEAVYLN